MTLYPIGLNVVDTELWDAATGALARTYRTGRHEVAAAVRTRSGAIHVGVHMAGSAGRSSVCAEAMALGSVLTAAEAQLATVIDTVLAVLHRPGPERGTMRMIAACGLCRELLFDYCPDAWNYIHIFDPDTPVTQVPAEPEASRGITGPVDLVPGSVERLRVRDLMPGKNLRSW
ncbi:hypothetical protein [Prescottella equi]|uniref:hypothetical protein n=1 Tax=Rhodococcus hoagii TaxID=43767 RepID=UPI002741747A|nr:hypothetical protein [Prescottella equi]MDP8015163.1 hypothetical protein [Prescottella equi]